MKQKTKQNYRQRLIAVIDYIYHHLGDDLDVNVLAEVAMMSPYHFHRIYREMANETINATVRRLRLQYAASELISNELSLDRIAKKVSYSSLEAFSRAFSKQFGEPPSEYRERHRMSDCLVQPFVAMLPDKYKEYQAMYDVDITDISPISLVGYEHRGDYMRIGSAFEKLFIYAGSHELVNDKTRSIGLYYDDPKTVDSDQLKSMACISIGDNESVDKDSGLSHITIPEGKCASVLHKGAYAELEKPYDWFFGHWLPQSDYDAANFPAFEEYLNDPKTTPPNELLTRIYCLLA